MRNEAKGYIVVIEESEFLGLGGKIVDEYPDARIFASKASAEVAAGIVRLNAIRARPVARAAYDQE